MPVVATQEGMAMIARKAKRLIGEEGIVIASVEDYAKIYGPNVLTIPYGRIVSIWDTKINFKKSENPNGDIWCRIKDDKHEFYIWVPLHFLDLS